MPMRQSNALPSSEVHLARQTVSNPSSTLRSRRCHHHLAAQTRSPHLTHQRLSKKSSSRSLPRRTRRRLPLSSSTRVAAPARTSGSSSPTMLRLSLLSLSKSRLRALRLRSRRKSRLSKLKHSSRTKLSFKARLLRWSHDIHHENGS